MPDEGRGLSALPQSEAVDAVGGRRSVRAAPSYAWGLGRDVVSRRVERRLPFAQRALM